MASGFIPTFDRLKASPYKEMKAARPCGMPRAGDSFTNGKSRRDAI
jgi:hypothetical protein